MNYRNHMNKKRTNQLLEVNTAKSAFISRVSHDILTPLNGILGMARFGYEESTDMKSQDQFRKIMSSGNYLMTLVNDVLDIAKLEQGKIELHDDIVDISEFLKEIEEILDVQIKQKRLDLHINVNNVEHTYLKFDRLRVQQVFINLIGNAIKFSDPGGTIICTFSKLFSNNEDDQYELIVHDEGIGISEEFQKRLFLPFEQENNQYSKEYTGSGLGLSIVKSIVESMGGKVSVNSKLGQGTDFIIDLSVKTASEDEISKVLQEHKKKEFNFSGKRVLLVEDNEINLEVAKVLLEQKEMIVDTAENGEEAVNRFLESKPFTYDVILMDIRMPKMNGMIATTWIRSFKRKDAKKVPIIAMTADTLSSGEEDTKKAGMNDYISKPIIVDKLYEILNKYLGE